MAMKAGYGKVMWLEPIYDRGGIAGYMQKLSDVLIGDKKREDDRYKKAAAELVGAAKKGFAQNQIPMEAPPHFRRLRASQGLLPPVKKDPEITGELVQKMLEVVEAQLERDGLLAEHEYKKVKKSPELTPKRIAALEGEAKERHVPEFVMEEVKGKVVPLTTDLMGVMNDTTKQEWWNIQWVTRRAFEKAKPPIPEDVARAEIKKLKESFYRGRDGT